MGCLMPSFSSLENADVEYLRGKANLKNQETEVFIHTLALLGNRITEFSSRKDGRSGFRLTVSKDRRDRSVEMSEWNGPQEIPPDPVTGWRWRNPKISQVEEILAMLSSKCSFPT